MFDPNFQTPRSLEMNIGILRELRRGMVLSADYVRSVQTHYLLGIDENHTGDIRYFNKAAALQVFPQLTSRLVAEQGQISAAFNAPSAPALI